MGNLKKGCLHIYCGDGKGKTTAAGACGSGSRAWDEGTVLSVYEGRNVQ